MIEDFEEYEEMGEDKIFNASFDQNQVLIRQVIRGFEI